MEGLEPEDPTPMYAGFDSPYVPGFMRRNEVMLRMSTNWTKICGLITIFNIKIDCGLNSISYVVY